ncbi:MAG: hypothetical protein OEO18_08705 [Gammaproteobacteria bacterium]|nr:hypothetical protein [Gammaproteobacteria bacterium]
MARIFAVAGLIAFLLMSATVSAQDGLIEGCENISAPDEVGYFKDFATQIRNAKILYCSKTPFNVPDYPDSFVSALDHLKAIGAKDTDLSAINAALALFLQDNRMPQMVAKNRGRIEMNQAPYQVIGDIPDCDSRASALTTGGDCDQAIKEFVEIYNDGQAFYSLYQTIKTRGQIETVETRWDAFLEHSKSQTIWELALNGWLYKDSESAGFKRPPSGQWILLHPGLVIENVSDATDGDQTQAVLSLDVVGYNNWTREEWYIPSGISYNVLYSDRPDIKDWGNAVSLHFKSKYILGFSKHGDNEGWFVSIDLLESLKEKKQHLEAYTGNF